MQERGYQKIQILFKVKSLNKINIFKNSSSSKLKIKRPTFSTILYNLRLFRSQLFLINSSNNKTDLNFVWKIEKRKSMEKRVK